MSKPVQTMHTDVVIVGSGPGGATMARELSRKGKKVIICEAGKTQNRYGNTLFLLGMMDRMGLTFSKEGTWVLRPKTVGGASVVFCGTAFKPPPWLKEKYGIDLAEEVDEVYKEIPIQPLPDKLIGVAAGKMMQAARDIGLDWNPIDKWIRPDKCELDCGKCFFGCKQEAKWTAKEFVDEAVENGADLLTRTTVDRVLTQNGKAVGARRGQCETDVVEQSQHREAVLVRVEKEVQEHALGAGHEERRPPRELETHRVAPQPVLLRTRPADVDQTEVELDHGAPRLHEA